MSETLAALGVRWLASRATDKPSPHSEAARRADLATIAALAAERLGRPAGPPEAERAPRELGRLVPADLAGGALAEAFSDYAGGHAPRSVRRVLSTWRGFCAWMVARGHLAADPLAEVRGPRRPDWTPKPLELVELERVVEAAGAPDPRGRHPWPERDRALVAVFAGAGVRIGEVIAMRVGDVEARDRSPRLRVLGKGSKRRVLPVGPEVVVAIDAYLDDRRARVGGFTSTDALFVRHDGRSFTRGTLDYLVLGWFRRAGVAPPPGSLAHALRHTYATLLVDAGASLPEVQRLLGHADLGTTQVYLGVTGQGLEAAALANPARRLLGGRP